MQFKKYHEKLNGETINIVEQELIRPIAHFTESSESPKRTEWKEKSIPRNLRKVLIVNNREGRKEHEHLDFIFHVRTSNVRVITVLECFPRTQQ